MFGRVPGLSKVQRRKLRRQIVLNGIPTGRGSWKIISDGGGGVPHGKPHHGGHYGGYYGYYGWPWWGWYPWWLYFTPPWGIPWGYYGVWPYRYGY